MKYIINIIMLFALFIVQAHDIIQHEHDHVLDEAEADGLTHDEKSAHFELSDIFSNFYHSGNHLVFSKAAGKHLSNRLKLLKAEYIFQYFEINIISHTKPVRQCIRDNQDLYKPEVSFLFSLRAPPVLFS